METNKELMRAEFEAWCKKRQGYLYKVEHEDGTPQEDMWNGWQAALSQRSEAVDVDYTAANCGCAPNEACDICQGRPAPSAAAGEQDEYADCPKCNGSSVRGEIRGVRCVTCNGTATVRVDAEEQVSVAVNDYSDMSREALERHATRMAQALANDKARKFHDKYATGPMMPPSCLCCGQLPDKVAIRHAELPGIVICEKCATRQSSADARDAARYRALRDRMTFVTDKGSHPEMSLMNWLPAPDHNPHTDWVADRFEASVDRVVDSAIAASEQANKREGV